MQHDAKGIMVGKANVAGTPLTALRIRLEFSREDLSGRTANLDPFLAGLEGSLSSEQVLPLWGEATADNVSFRQAYQYCDDEIAPDGVAYALLSGETRASLAIAVSAISRSVVNER